MPQRTPFHKILIANRGEIALRVMRTARSMGYRTVAVYSTVDAGAPHVRTADQAIPIGNPPPKESYLNIGRIIDAARKSGADAVHPGYGFLAENADFAAACTAADLVFIGPTARAIELMGNKAGAKRLMLEAGVPCVPGYQGDDQDENQLLLEASKIGFPIMIKAASGGGGRGIRLVNSAGEFRAALHTAKSEAQGSFGDPTVILEKAIVRTRHIEVQVVADRYGKVIHLGERDCSVQRRHQKLIEEAPSPAVSPELRERIGATAVAASTAVGYEGLGTIEYLLDPTGHYYFMEMNTRLQVEHPVTEAITRLDLVELQLRMAAGEPLTIGQQDVQFRGHAIEARLCSEDAGRSFMPEAGTMRIWQVPANVRVEHALESGGVVPPYYDSMIAKFIATGVDRDEARRRLLIALEDAVALGVTTNQSFLASCLRHPTFAAGQATTAFIETEAKSLFARDEAAFRRATAIAARLLLRGSDRPAVPPRSGVLSSRLPISLRFEMEGEVVAASVIERAPNVVSVTVQKRTSEIALQECDWPRVRLVCDGIAETIVGVQDDDKLRFLYAGSVYCVRDLRFSPVLRRDAASDGIIRASTSGRVVALHAIVGDMLAAGAPVITLEAMKMEHTHVAPRAGRLVSLRAEMNEQVTAHHPIAEIEVDMPSGGANTAESPPVKRL